MIMDDRRKRLLYRAMHRGMKETDALIGGFASSCLPELSEEDLITFELLLNESDNDLLSWTLERAEVPNKSLVSIVERVIAYRKSL